MYIPYRFAADTDFALLMDATMGVIWTRLLFDLGSLDPDEAPALTEAVLAGHRRAPRKG